MYLNYPNNPTGAVVAGRPVRARPSSSPARHDVLVVHDASYTETTFDGYVAPSFLETPGAKDVGVEVFSLSKGYNMTGWRTAAIVGNAEARRGLLAAEDEHRLGHVRGRAAGRRRGARAAATRSPREMCAIYQRRRDLVCDALREIGVDVTPPKGTIYIWAPVPEGHDSASYCELVLEESGVVVSPGGAYGPNGEGFFRISLTVARRAPQRGGRAAALEPRGLAMGYCGIEVGPGYAPAVRAARRCAPRSRRCACEATFYEPGRAAQVAARG